VGDRTRHEGAADPGSRAHRDRELFNRIAGSYARKDLHRAARIARRHRFRQTIGVVRLDGDVSMLEIGCGAGFSARYLRGLYARYTGLDYADALIEYARGNHADANTTFVAADVRDYEPAQQVDVALMLGVLHHFEEVEATLVRIREMVRPGGWVIANEPQSSNALIQLMRRVRMRVDTSYSAEQTQFDPTSIRALFEHVGLQDVVVRPQGMLSTPFAEVPLQPTALFAPLTRASVLADTAAEATLGRWLLPVSWNVIAAGRVPPHDGRDR